MIKLQPSKEQLLEEIRAEQQRLMATYLTSTGRLFQSDPKSVQAIVARADLARETDRIPWVLADNSVAEFTKNALKYHAAEMAMRNDHVFMEAARLKKLVERGHYIDAKDPANWI